MQASTGTPQDSGDFPSVFYAVIRWIDRFTDVTGRLFALTQILLVAIITYEITSRYFFGAPTVWAFEGSTMANGASFMLACGYALYKGAHVRTDIFWEKYSERRKGVIDLVSYLVLFFPTMIGNPNTTQEMVIVLLVFVVSIVAGLVNWFLMDPGFFGM